MVLESLLLNGGQLFKLLIGNGGQNCADPGKGDFQILYQFVIHGVSCNHQLGLQSAGSSIITGVDNGAVGLGGIAAYILVLVNHNDIHFVLGKLTGNSATNGACTDHNHICFQHFHTPS